MLVRLPQISLFLLAFQSAAWKLHLTKRISEIYVDYGQASL